MKKYSDRELDVKINTFLERKFEKYPELNRSQPTSLRRYRPLLSHA